MGKAVFITFIGVVMAMLGVINSLQGLVIFGALFVVGGVGALVLRGMTSSANASKGEQWMAEFPNAKYKFADGVYGVAIENEKIHLCEDGYTKSYPLSDVRTWRTNLQTGGSVMNQGSGLAGALSTGSMNRQIENDNIKNSGLFISVRDVNKPEWRIHFSTNSEEEKRQQAKWNEILNQSLRDNVAA